ncbi:aldehyde dehydrogenase [Mycolicibacterium sp.]|uniref:aldehyde dehydrogenase n=1 Tax=Mycolicibacterium sp. TaxID=2320850 RepID=UPI003D119ECE
MQLFTPAPRPDDGTVADYPMVVGGNDIGADTWRDVTDPFTGRVWARVPEATPEQVDHAVAAARQAFTSGPWSTSTPAQRAKALRGLAQVLAAHTEELTRLQVMENGKAIREQYAQTLGLPDHLHYFAGAAEINGGRTIPASSRDMLNYTVREPIGVVAALTPWNSPLSLLMWKLAPALAAGNTVVVKPSEVTPVSAIRFGQLCREAGLPDGVVNVVTGAGEPGALLAAHPGVDKVAFTGSTAVGRKVAVAAGERLAQVSLELGGKSPNIIFDDADLAAGLEGVVGGIFAAAGQTCIAGSRILVQRGVYDEFLDRFAERVARIRLGDPLDWDTEVGTIASPAQFDKVLDYIKIAHADGARLVTGGAAAERADSRLFVEPTVFADVTNSMRIAREEVFGPIAAVLPFGSEEEAIAIANDTPFGLAAGVWTQNLGRAHRCASALRAGTVWVNTYRKTNYASPFGGYKDSGIGRENGFDAMLEFTEVKSVWIDAVGRMSDPFNPFG